MDGQERTIERHLVKIDKASDLQKRDSEDRLGPIRPEETQLLRKLYEPVEEEGLDKFDSALSKTMHEFNV